MKSVKVRFQLDETLWHGSATETLWAIANNDGLRRIDNLPFLAFGISFNDMVITSENSSGIEDFVSVYRPGGHSTYRIIVHSNQTSEVQLKNIADAGCLYEVAKIGDVLLISISVPPDVDIREIYKKLEAGESFGIWDFEESNFEHSV